MEAEVKMGEVVYLNGRLMPLAEAKISILDYGFLYGYGLFETMRSYDGVVFRLDQHLERLATSAAILKIPVDVAGLSSAIMETMRANALKDARIRLTVSIGEGGMIPDIKSSKQTTIFIMAQSFSPYGMERYEKGFRIVVSPVRRDSLSTILRMKTANYVANMIARQEALAIGADDALFLDELDCVTETTTSNIFMCNGDILKTPCLDKSILPGITRDIVIGLAAQYGIKAIETDIYFEDLTTADEAFVTNSIMEIMPITVIDKNQIGFGKIGSVTRTLMNAYRDLVQEMANKDI